MSRKTEEIKLRVTADEKASWQAAASRDGIGLSELIRMVLNERVNQNAPLRGIGAEVLNSTPPQDWERAVMGDADAIVRRIKGAQ